MGVETALAGVEGDDDRGREASKSVRSRRAVEESRWPRPCRFFTLRSPVSAVLE